MGGICEIGAAETSDRVWGLGFRVWRREGVGECRIRRFFGGEDVEKTGLSCVVSIEGICKGVQAARGWTSDRISS
jgi:hypothetical protein